ncbi:MAG: cytochrome c [Chloroflexi bacterium]|nr:cytochrome c [Chloroflexota bacterium]
MYTKLAKYVYTWSSCLLFGLALVLILTACNDVDQNSTVVSELIRPIPTVTPTPAPTKPPVATVAGAAAAPSGNVANGLALFKSNGCETCHPSGGTVAGIGLLLKGTQQTDAYIRNQLQNGKNLMAAFPQITAAQQTDLIAYIRSLSPSTAPAAAAPAAAAPAVAAPAAATTAGDPVNGLALFKSNNCTSCHLDEGRTEGIGLKLQGTTRDDTYIRNQITTGRNLMPAFPTVTDAQKTDLIAYIRYLSGPTGSVPPTAAPAGAAAPAAAAPAAAAPAAAAPAAAAPAAAAPAAAGDPAKGLALFRANGCVMCHLNEGRTAGPVCPQLKGTARDDTYIRNQIANGRNAMPPFASVTEDQKTDIIAYIRYLSGPTGDALPPGASPAG